MKDPDNYFTYEKKEISNLIIFSFLLGIMFSFDQWDAEKLKVGLVHLTLSAILVFIGLVLFTSTQKYFAHKQGYSHKSEFSYQWLSASLLFAVVSFGSWMIPLGYGAQYEILTRQRLGKFRYGLNFWTMAMISMTGVIALFLSALIFKILNVLFSSYLFFQGTKIMLFLAIFSMLPLPPMIGSYLFFSSRKIYVLLFSLIVLSAILIEIFPVIVALLIAAVISAIIFILFTYFET